jgi:hypothetical protein
MGVTKVFKIKVERTPRDGEALNPHCGDVIVITINYFAERSST